MLLKPSIYKRKSDGKWVGQLELPPDVTGKRRRKIVYGNTKKEVEAKANKIAFLIETGEYTEDTKETLIGFLNQYYDICLNKWAPTTAALNKMYIDVHFEPYFKKMKLKEIKPIVLNAFYKDRLDGKTRKAISVNTVIKLNKFLKSAFNYAVKNKMISSNPTDYVILPSKQQYNPRVYSEKEFGKLLDSVKNTDDEIPILLGGGCGLRRGEIFGLKWKNINFKDNTISIEETKVRFNKNIIKTPKTQKSKRTISVPEYVIEVLSNYKIIKCASDNENIVTKWKPGSYSAHFSEILKQYNLPHCRLHDLRHYNATIMVVYGVSNKVAAERLGHSQTSTLVNIYQHVIEGMDKSAADKIDNMFQTLKDDQSKNDEHTANKIVKKAGA